MASAPHQALALEHLGETLHALAAHRAEARDLAQVERLRGGRALRSSAIRPCETGSGESAGSDCSSCRSSWKSEAPASV